MRSRYPRELALRASAATRGCRAALRRFDLETTRFASVFKRRVLTGTGTAQIRLEAMA